ncbi:hypothetical protein ACQQ2N_00130 [Dokdonella sp. MW10]|uniref:hypothetical protein n=1 Tax=Dokdonella sp. MW10 TaxID=2992926 RepID=UPI003F7F38A4
MRSRAFGWSMAWCVAVPALAHAQWLPEWSSADPQSADMHDGRMIDVLADAHGRSVLLTEWTHANRSGIALRMWEADGRLAWRYDERLVLSEGVAWSGDGRLAVFGVFDEVAGARVLDAASGTLLHTCTWPRGGMPAPSVGAGRRSGAVSSQGHLLHVSLPNRDVLVSRCDAGGLSLPEWRWSSGFATLVTPTIVPTADGGAVVTAAGGIGEGFVTVRFGAGGDVVFVDREFGDLGNPLGLPAVAVDAAGAVLVAAEPESSAGVHRGQVWKIAPAGLRAWTRRIAIRDPLDAAHLFAGLIVSADGDAFVAPFGVRVPGGFRVVRVQGGDGHVLSDTTAGRIDRIEAMARSAGGRMLVAGSRSAGFGNPSESGFAEFAASGAACRFVPPLGLRDDGRVASAPQGWIVAGIRLPGAGIASAIVVHRFEAGGPCDIVMGTGFDDGFDAVPASVMTPR